MAMHNGKPEVDTTEIRFIHMEANNFQDFPLGGTLSFARQLIGQFKGQVALVGLVTDDMDPVGRWFEKEINGVFHQYFGIGRFKKTDSMPLIPIRIQTFLLLLFYLKRIRVLNNKHVFTQSPQFLFALSYFRWDSLCFCFAGISNAVAMSRYTYLRSLGIVYEKILFKILKRKATTVLAAADSQAIKDAVTRSGNILKAEEIITFPTRFDPSVFLPMDKAQCRLSLGIKDEEILLVTTGRLGWVKGWQLLIDTTRELYADNDFKNIRLIFVGDGEDRKSIENYDRSLFDKGIIRLVGKLSREDIALYLNACDVFVMGSHHEGWPTSLVEALACGCRLVTTNVSAASEIVCEGRNGYILNDRNPVNFAKLIKKALTLENTVEYSLNARSRFSVDYLKDDLERLWLSKT